MISLYRWLPDQKFGTWAEPPDLPANGCHLPEGEVWWIDLGDPSEEEEALVFKKFLPVHPLTLDDITRSRREPDQAPHLPKVEPLADDLFVIANPLRPAIDSHRPETDPARCVVQLSSIVTEQVLITHHYPTLSAVGPVKQFLDRHAEQAGRGPNYLLHSVLDQIVDDYARAVDGLVTRLDEIEVQVFERPSQQLVSDLVRLQRRVIALRKTLILMREVLTRSIRGELDLVEDREIVYYRNVFDHLVRYTELIEGARELVSDLMQTHLAAQSNKLNGIIKAPGDALDGDSAHVADYRHPGDEFQEHAGTGLAIRLLHGPGIDGGRSGCDRKRLLLEEMVVIVWMRTGRYLC